ncbi:MAG: MnhB domain-containing protein [Candidatus Omnitrophota bacterium]
MGKQPFRDDRGMTLIVKTVTRFTLGFIFIYGIYIALTGHESPGGGFAGGVIVALSFVHTMLAFGKEVALKRLRANLLRFIISIGALVFLYIAIVSFSGRCVQVNKLFYKEISCHIFNNSVIIPFCEMIIVGAGLFAIFVALVLLSKADKDFE